jgi:hypothetical protein
MKRCLACVAVFGMVLAGTAKSPWTKAFKDWTRGDADLIMMKSPWAKRTAMPAGGRPSVIVLEHGDMDAPPPSATLGNPSNTTSGVNMSTAGNPGSGRPADPGGIHNLPTSQTPSSAQLPDGAPHRGSDLTVIWASAEPVRLAVLRQRSGDNTPTGQQVERATRATPDYVIAVAGLPAPDRDTDPEALKSDAFLCLKGKSPVPAARSAYRKIGSADVYFFHFPKAMLPIAVGDGQVEFRLTIGRMQLRRKFDLNEMVFQGALAL